MRSRSPFDARIRELGGDIWYNCEVRRIDVKDNRVRGVELASGEYIPCGWVMSNVMPSVGSTALWTTARSPSAAGAL